MSSLHQRVDDYKFAVLHHRWTLFLLGLLSFAALYFFGLFNWRFYITGCFFAASGCVLMIWRSINIEIFYFFWAISVVVIIHFLINSGGLQSRAESLGNMIGAVVFLYGVYGVGSSYFRRKSSG